jgi:glycyl-tRNA synthetase beta chain
MPLRRLAVPQQECLILTMQTNQKHFALTDRWRKSCARAFWIVSNPAATTTCAISSAGNERCARAWTPSSFRAGQEKSLESRLPHPGGKCQQVGINRPSAAARDRHC